MGRQITSYFVNDDSIERAMLDISTLRTAEERVWGCEDDVGGVTWLRRLTRLFIRAIEREDLF